MAEENTHGQLIMSAHQAAAGELNIGTITLPADGPWLIHGVYCQIANVTAVAAESLQGYLRIDAAVGDLEPNPAPTRFPFAVHGSTLGATIDQTICELNIFPTAWTAPGRAGINMIVNHPIATTDIPIAIAGIIYGKSVPETKPIIYCDTARLAKTTAADQQVGTITLSERATRITGVCGVLSQNGVLTTAEELIGFFRLASNDIDVVPAQFPFQAIFGAGLGALIQGAPQMQPSFIPVDIPVVKGAVITAFAQFQTAVTNAADVEIFIAYE